jgi:predicted GNAT family acetyltransferase
MRYGTRELDGATCKVLKPEALPEHMFKDVREIIKVHVPTELRGQGLATKLLESVCKEADTKKMILVITVDPYDDSPMTKEQLANWYGSTFEFQVIQQEPLMMARMHAVYIKKPIATAVDGTLTIQGI